MVTNVATLAGVKCGTVKAGNDKHLARAGKGEEAGYTYTRRNRRSPLRLSALPEECGHFVGCNRDSLNQRHQDDPPRD